MAKCSSAVVTVMLAVAAFEMMSMSTAWVGVPRAPQTIAPKVARPLQSDAIEQQADLGQFARAAVSMLAAIVITFMPIAEAHAAKTGGRIGGTAPSAKPRPPPSRAAPQQAVKERVVEKKTVIIQQAAPAGGMMMAPAAPSLGDMVVGAAVQGAVGGAVSGAVQNAMRGPSTGASSTDRMLEMQQRQDERQLDKQANDIEDLKRALAEAKKQ